jgi:hypothetical protein
MGHHARCLLGPALVEQTPPDLVEQCAVAGHHALLGEEGPSPGRPTRQNDHGERQARTLKISM